MPTFIPKSIRFLIVKPTPKDQLGDKFEVVYTNVDILCSLSERAKPLKPAWEHTIGTGHATLILRAVVLMIENYLTGFLWQLMKRCSYLVSGLRRAGFLNGWLAKADVPTKVPSIG